MWGFLVGSMPASVCDFFLSDIAVYSGPYIDLPLYTGFYSRLSSGREQAQAAQSSVLWVLVTGVGHTLGC